MKIPMRLCATKIVGVAKIRSTFRACALYRRVSMSRFLDSKTWQLWYRISIYTYSFVLTPIYIYIYISLTARSGNYYMFTVLTVLAILGVLTFFLLSPVKKEVGTIVIS